jgi:small neutral amino acid transporter SnatA (MarC family)
VRAIDGSGSVAHHMAARHAMSANPPKRKKVIWIAVAIGLLLLTGAVFSQLTIMEMVSTSMEPLVSGQGSP